MSIAAKRIFQFENIRNFRDLGGIPVGDGSTIRNGLVYRSGRLSHSSEADVDILAGLGIKTIVDLRGRELFESHLPPLPFGDSIRLLNLPIFNAEIEGLISRLQEIPTNQVQERDGADLMVGIYRTFARSFVDQVKGFFGVLLDASNLPLIVHCTAGKDRTGFMVALLLSALGVEYKEIEKDYLLSNEHHRDLGRHLKEKYKIAEKSAQAVADARAEYLAASYDEIAREYGSIESYLEDAIAIGSGEREVLKSNLLCPVA